MDVSRIFEQPPDSARMAAGGSALENLDVSSIVPERVLSAEEIRVLMHKFTLCNADGNSIHHRALSSRTRMSSTQASKLFREDYPALSEWEVQDMFHKSDLDGDGHLSLTEYLQTRAYYRMLLEESTETELQRIFSVLDTDADGLLLADEVLHRIKQTGMHDSVAMLKEVITQAVAATKRADNAFETTGSNPQYHREGEITFEHFASTIRDVNRKMEQEIATKMLRMIDLQKHQKVLQTQTSLASVHDQRMVASLRVEIEVLVHEIRRTKQDLITDSNNALAQACETLVANYENEQHVYECLYNFIAYCNLHDGPLFRYNLERAGKEVHILNSMLLAPPEHLKKTTEFAKMMDLSLHRESHKVSATARDARSPAPRQHDAPNLTRPVTAQSTRPTSARHPATQAMMEALLMNPTLRKQFAYYAMAGNVTNLVSISRTSFAKFVKDCGLHNLPTPALTDVDIGNIFATASGTAKTMDFPQWLSACVLVFERVYPRQEPLTEEELEKLLEAHVIPRAKSIHVQHLAPDISQTHVMKLLKENIWQFKQIFSHFGIQSLVEVDSKVRLDMKEFLTFARAFSIIRVPTDRDGEPYTPPPMPPNASIAPISLMELIREYYAAKLDISITDATRREAPDLSFREFLRCVQRIALAMHVHKPKKPEAHRANGVLTTSFEATKDDSARSPQRARAALYQRRGNLLGLSPTKNCKMASTSIISTLLRTSRDMVAKRDNQDQCFDAAPRFDERPSSRRNIPTSSAAKRPATSSGHLQAIDKSASTINPARPSWSRKTRRRPITSGGPPIIRVIRAPIM